MLSHLEWEHAVVVFEWVDFNILSNHSLCMCVCVVFFFVFQYIKFLNVRTVILVVELNVDAWKWKHCVCELCMWTSGHGLTYGITVFCRMKEKLLCYVHWTHCSYNVLHRNLFAIQKEKEKNGIQSVNDSTIYCNRFHLDSVQARLFFIWFFFLCVLLLERPNVYFMRVTQPRRRWLRQRQLQFNSIFFVW